jgi:hypothetical protein
MVYWNNLSNRYEPSTPVLLPNIRLHVALWRRFQKVSGRWPTPSIIAYVVRFVIAVGAIVVSLSYGDRHNLHKGSELLLGSALVCSLIGAWWFFIELRLWNHDLRREGISSKRDLWDTDQFPSE